jgi:hypothetical protein
MLLPHTELENDASEHDFRALDKIFSIINHRGHQRTNQVSTRERVGSGRDSTANALDDECQNVLDSGDQYLKRGGLPRYSHKREKG